MMSKMIDNLNKVDEGVSKKHLAIFSSTEDHNRKEDVACYHHNKIRGFLLEPDELQRNANYTEYNNGLYEVLAKFAKTKYKYKAAIWDGWVCGDSAGLSHHCDVRLATEKTIWQLPDLNKGYFLDPGSSYFLSHFRGEYKPNVGLYLALTNKRLTGQEAV